jgi:competence protein ComEC
LITWHDKFILFITGDIPREKPFRVDYVILSGNAVRDLKKLEWLEAEKIIIDSSNSFYLAERLLEQGKTLNKNIYSVRHQGAYEETISL